VRFGVVVFPGSNCDRDAFHVLNRVLGQEAVYLWHQEGDLRGVDAVVIPGGFSFGDYLRCGAIAKFSPVMASIRQHADRGGLVLGICNGFQILQEAGLLPGALLRNAGLKFLCQQVHLSVGNSDTPFTGRIPPNRVLKMPIAHNDGNFFLPPDQLRALEANRQVVFRYSQPDGTSDAAANPNGSLNNIAAITNDRGNVLGLMPHPERAGEEILGSADGLLVFQSMVESLAGVESQS